MDASEPRQESEAEFLERVRRSGIKVDRQGRFWHEGEQIVHQGLRQALFRWLDRLPPPESRYILRLDAQRFAYLDVEDTPLVATSLRWQGAGPQEQALLGLQDGSEEPLDPATVTVDGEGILRCLVRAGRIEVRLDTAAAAALAEKIEGPAGERVLLVGGRREPIRRRV